MKKAIYIALGCFFLGVAAVGAIVPMLPSFPFLLLVSFFFMKGSDRLNNWFMQTELYKKHLLSFKEKKGLTLKAKLSVLIPVYIMLGILFITKDILAMRIMIVVLLAIKTVVFIKMKTLQPEELGRIYDAEQTIN